MKSFYKFLVYELDYPVDVAARIRILKVYTPLKAILTEDEVMRLLCSGQQLDSRLSPVRTLERSHVRLADRVIYFPKVKGGQGFVFAPS
ncbi:hypothetical protein MKZ26_17730 [Sporosarcina sp. FSL K6-6792]|uniref:hypothetical protein n=1 Tax=Sporosarcina sp. FSL K6-6792 TaxID=2921559 RepID=UPI0030F7D9F2